MKNEKEFNDDIGRNCKKLNDRENFDKKSKLGKITAS